MSTTEQTTTTAPAEAPALSTVPLKFEVTAIPVTDVDRATRCSGAVSLR